MGSCTIHVNNCFYVKDDAALWIEIEKQENVSRIIVLLIYVRLLKCTASSI